MQTATYDGPSFDEDKAYEEDKRLGVQFYYEAVQNNFKSAAEGRPIFDEIPMVRIFTPGSRDVMVTRANETYQRRFERQWEKFKKQQAQVTEGTPLEQVTFLTVGQVAELKAVNCFTLEQLAGMSDTAANKMMGMNGLRDKAKMFLQAAADMAPLTKMKSELEKRDNEIEVLQRQVKELGEALQKLQPVAKKA